MNYFKKWLIRLLLLVIFVVAMLAAADNSESVSLTFLNARSWAWPISWWMLLAFVLGVVFGLLLNTWSNTKLRYKARQAGKQAVQSRTVE